MDIKKFYIYGIDIGNYTIEISRSENNRYGEIMEDSYGRKEIRYLFIYYLLELFVVLKKIALFVQMNH